MWLKNARYLDYNAGAGLHPRVQEGLRELLASPEFFAANPSSRHRLGQKMQHLLYRSARQVALSLGIQNPDSLLFTSSGTEANQTVIRSALKQGMTVLIGTGEHSASYDLLNEATERVGQLQAIPLLPTGQYDLGQIYNLLTYPELHSEKERAPKTILLSLFWANNETGVLSDLTQLSSTLTQLRKEFPHIRFYLHLDGAQVWGKLPLALDSTPADWITFSAHKIGAPAGVGLVWSRQINSLEPLILGSQAKGLRGGTENWLGIAALGMAAETLTPASIAHFAEHTTSLRNRFEQLLEASTLPIHIWGKETQRLGNTSRFGFTDFKTYENWVELLDLRGFAVSHGSACKAQVIEPSRVLLEMGAGRDAALNSIRVSFGPDSLAANADELVAQLIELYHNKHQA